MCVVDCFVSLLLLVVGCWMVEGVFCRCCLCVVFVCSSCLVSCCVLCIVWVSRMLLFDVCCLMNACVVVFGRSLFCNGMFVCCCVCLCLMVACWLLCVVRCCCCVWFVFFVWFVGCRWLWFSLLVVVCRLFDGCCCVMVLLVGVCFCYCPLLYGVVVVVFLVIDYLWYVDVSCLLLFAVVWFVL